MGKEFGSKHQRQLMDTIGSTINHRGMDQQVQMAICYKAKKPIFLDVETRESQLNNLQVEQLYFEYTK